MRALFVLIVGLLAISPARAQELFQDENDFANADVDRIYVKGLNFLAKTQLADGTWPDKPYGGEPAVVALSIIAIRAINWFRFAPTANPTATMSPSATCAPPSSSRTWPRACR